MSEEEKKQLDIDEAPAKEKQDAEIEDAPAKAERDFVDDMDLTREIELDDIFGDEKGAGDFDDTKDLTGGLKHHGRAEGVSDETMVLDTGGLKHNGTAEGVSDETMVLTIDDLGEISEKKPAEDDLDKTAVLGFDEIPNPWRDEEDEVLDLFGKEGRTRIYPKNEDLPSETMVLNRNELKDELSEEEAAAEKLRRAAEAKEADEAEEAARKAAEEDFAAEEQGKKRKHYKTHFFLKVALLLIALGATAAFALSPVFTIRNVEVEGNKFYTDEQIINMSNVETGGNLFINAQKSEIKSSLKDNIYFKTVRVKRKIPATLVIDVEEREELAGVKYGDRYVVIDQDAVVLRIARLDPEVTEITGLKIMKMEPGETIQVEEKKIFKDALATLHTMKEGDLFFKRMEIEDMTITAFIYDMLKVKGSSEKLRASIEEGTLQKVVNKLMKSDIKRGTIILGENGYISFSPAV